ncbi:hypothetical protein [Thalassococcus sp. S3]|uniref:hypothetical protein n=1 Tax=Thalassococcus sp. S3 TaxID=2017482 RepID=UPI00102426AD|nr:hypothetical protein [Thalassococcus sp. S3]QBF29694.1 hypothetical protein CFI11_00495 [Thalassococcus sp. S3]
MRHYLLSFLFVFTAFSAYAQTVTIRSGDHPTFTRLVFTVPTNARWTLETDRSTVSLSLAGGPFSFDISGVFSRIDRNRVRDVRPRAGRNNVLIDLACDCDVQAFKASDTLLVVDVSDQAETAETSKTRASFLDFSNSVTPYRFSAVANDQLIKRPVLPSDEDKANEDIDGSWDANRLLDDAAARTRNVNASERRLLEQIGRAATQGLLETRAPNLDQIKASSDRRNPPVDSAEIPQDPAPRSSPRTTRNGQVSIKATSSIDQELAAVLGEAFTSGDGQACLPDTALDLASWGDGRPFHQQIGDLRLALYGEFDAISPSSVLSLAKTYLHFGFGTEAIHSLSLSPSRGEEFDTLFAMAKILDGLPSPRPSPFAGQMDCQGDAAMWSVLAAGRIEKGAPIKLEALQRTISDLPPHLRGQLGPRLASYLNDAAYHETAKTILRFVERGSKRASDESILVQSEISEKAGETDKANAMLEEVVESGSDLAPLALLKRVRYAEQRGLGLDPETPLLIESYISELDGTDVSISLKDALVRAYAILGDFPAAFKALSLFRSDHPNEDTQDLVGDFADALTETANDVTFLDIVFDGLKNDVATLSDASRTKLADRLVALGFAQRAMDVLAKSERPLPDQRITMARAALSLGRPRQAELHLLGLETEEAHSLRAEALEQAGDFEEILALEGIAPESDVLRRAAWHLGRDGGIAAEEGSPYQTPALPQPSNPIDVERERSLSHSSTLLASSADLRLQLNDLLKTHSVLQDR